VHIFTIATTSGAEGPYGGTRAAVPGTVQAATGGWQVWATVTATVTLPPRQQTLTVDQDNGGWNVYYMAFSAAGPPSRE
jgi:hypothetical protein